MRRTIFERNAMEKSSKAQIKLLGIGSAKDRALKANLLATLEALDLEVELLEITNVNEILSYGISGIPAILLDDKIIFQKIVPSVEELCTVLNELLQYRESPKRV
ncbi:MAG: thioredoxin family protein [Haliscomenobacter sp.]|uniref:thioredoxin family protein n=1 Tax=Haliscomenobacter sp. TaxID=2717303 RepID=UPI0029A3E8AE|nr:thioredoxin family protein [Haliscomenobacter sp.]MDX2069573.1 thioredoxin family protein [Haliscomenobacter sp.]